MTTTTSTGQPHDGTEEKLCRTCGRSKNILEFYRDVRKSFGRSNLCKLCSSDYAAARRAADPHGVKRSKYRIDFNSMWLAQQGLCAVCGILMLPKGCDPESVVVDHDHRCCSGQTSCGKCVRGLIHKRCNLILGNAEDSPELLLLAAAYLKRQREALT